jgi:hypothetical protein
MCSGAIAHTYVPIPNPTYGGSEQSYRLALIYNAAVIEIVDSGSVGCNKSCNKGRVKIIKKNEKLTVDEHHEFML